MRLRALFGESAAVTLGMGAFSVICVQEGAKVYNNMQAGVHDVLSNPFTLTIYAAGSVFCIAGTLMCAYNTVREVAAPRLTKQ